VSPAPRSSESCKITTTIFRFVFLRKDETGVKRCPVEAPVLEFSNSLWARNRIGTGLSYQPARLHSLAESVSWNWNRFMGSFKIRALDNSELSSLHKLLRNRPVSNEWVYSRFRNNLCKDESALSSRFLHEMSPGMEFHTLKRYLFSWKVVLSAEKLPFQFSFFLLGFGLRLYTKIVVILRWCG
jgi:hypothetical protein